MLKNLMLIVTVSSAILAAPALAQTAAPATAAPTCPSGQVQAILRVSEITGTRAGYDQAVKDHIQWYRDHGYKENTITNTAVWGIGLGAPLAQSTTPQVLSIHRNPPGVPNEKHDEAWKAFTDKYAANSKILATIVTCLPK
jgi:hypothetical protein